MSANFTKNQEEITKAWRQVVDSKEKQCWALFGYEGSTNNIKLISSGSNGLKELVQEFNCSLIQYAFCRVIIKEQGLNKLVLINWQGDSSPLSRKGLCASHVGDVVNYFKGSTQTITIRNDDEATQEYLMDQILKTSSSRLNIPRGSIDCTASIPTEVVVSGDTKVGSSYKKTNINSEIPMDRKSFWQRQEEEEKERLLEEKKRAAEKQAQFEKERKAREESEAKKLAEAIRERDRLIEATRQADKRDSSVSSQPSSILSSSNANQDNDDERVGRRSELIRLERNQETHSLISKGLIKNKRAIFEQASQQSQQQSAVNTIARKTSGTIISQRLNSFKSLDCGSTSGNASVEKLTNGFAEKVSVSNDESANEAATVKKEIETIKITNDGGHEQSCVLSSQTASASVVNDTEATVLPESESAIVTNAAIEVVNSPDEIRAEATVNKNSDDAGTVIENATTIATAIETTSITKESPNENGNGCIISDSVVDSNGNSKFSKSPKQGVTKVESNEILMNGKSGIRAKALYDYQAADNTEISFDPDDIIGKIEKVDPGWWHGSVLTGHYKGQRGLFPANYVEELL